jgi:hypothetical protein
MAIIILAVIAIVTVVSLMGLMRASSEADKRIEKMFEDSLDKKIRRGSKRMIKKESKDE